MLASAVVASLGGWGAFRIDRPPAGVRCAPASSRGTAEDLLDLADDVDPARDHIRGGADATVTLLEYGDYECPYCGQAEVVVRELLGSFGADLRYVWRHLPLNDVHPRAEVSAEAAEAAAAQGEFWPMHDRLLADQELLDLGRHAEEIGLDMDRFWDDLSRHRHLARIAEDVASADASGVAGTPTFFINGRRHQGAYDIDTLTAAVKAAQRRAALRRRSRRSQSLTASRSPFTSLLSPCVPLIRATSRCPAGSGIPNESPVPCTISTGTATASSSGCRLGRFPGGTSGNARQSTPIALRLRRRPAGHPRPGRPPALDQRQPVAGQLRDDAQPRLVQPRRGRRRLAPGHPVRLLHQRHAHAEVERDSGRRHEVGRVHAPAGAVPERQHGARVLRVLDVDAGEPLRRLELEHRPMVTGLSRGAGARRRPGRARRP